MGSRLWRGVWAIATYPFFGKVAELVGRLTSIQGDCSISEIHRRMSEVVWRPCSHEACNAGCTSNTIELGAVKRVEKGKRIIRLAPTTIDSDELAAWLIEAAVRYAGKPVLGAQPAVAASAIPIHIVAAHGLCGVEKPEPGSQFGRTEQSIRRANVQR